MTAMCKKYVTFSNVFLLFETENRNFGAKKKTMLITFNLI